MSTIAPIPGNTPDPVKTGPGIQPRKNPEDDWLNKDLSENNHLPWQTYLPDEAVGLAGDIYKRGAEQLNGYIDPTANIPKSISLGANSTSQSPMSDAIQRKYERDVGNKLQGLRTQAQVGAPLAASKEMGRAADIYGKQRAIQMANFKEQYDFQTARKQQFAQWEAAKTGAQNAFIGQVIGGAFTFGAAMA